MYEAADNFTSRNWTSAKKTKDIQHKLFWMIARGIDAIPLDSNYFDERLEHRVHNLTRGLNMLGRETNHECLRKSPRV